MAKVECTKDYEGSINKTPKWIVFEKIFNGIWGKEAHSLPRYPDVIGGVSASWLNNRKIRFDAESLEEVQYAFNNKEILRLTFIGNINKKPFQAYFSYTKKNNTISFRYSSEREEETDKFILFVKKYFPNPIQSKIISNDYIKPKIIIELKNIKNKNFDLTKLVKFCEELNISFKRKNYLSCSLLIRAVMNHIPPIFGYNTFSQVVSNSNKSIKEILSQLENSRPIADLNNHALIGKRESLPSKNQIEPYKPSFEILILEIIKKLL